MSLIPWLLFLHILSAIVWLGGGVVLMLIAAYARSTSDPGPTTMFAHVVPFVGLRALTPAVVVLLLSGMSMILAGAGSFTLFWIQLALVLFLIAFLIGAIYMSRTAIQLDRTVAHGDIQKARSLMDRRLRRHPCHTRSGAVGHGVQAHAVISTLERRQDDFWHLVALLCPEQAVSPFPQRRTRAACVHARFGCPVSSARARPSAASASGA